MLTALFILCLIVAFGPAVVNAINSPSPEQIAASKERREAALDAEWAAYEKQEQAREKLNAERAEHQENCKECQSALYTWAHCDIDVTATCSSQHAFSRGVTGWGGSQA